MPDAPDRCPYCERAIDPERADFGGGVLACEYCGEIFTRPQPRRAERREGGTIDALFGGGTPRRAQPDRAAEDATDAPGIAPRDTSNQGQEDAPVARSAPAAVDPALDAPATAPPSPEADPVPPRDPAPAARPRAVRPATLLWTAGILVLLAVLAGQIAWQLRDQLARHQPLRPLLTTLCAYAGCEIPLLRAPERVRIVARDIRRHPEANDALRVSLTFSNDANFAQAWPDIRLRFLDLRDRVIAERRFAPEEYLPQNIDMTNGMPAHGALQTALEIVDPGADAVNFTFEFL